MVRASLNMTEHPDGIRVRLKVVPGASRERVVGVLGDALKVAVAKPPEGGAANRAMVQLLAQALDIPPRQIEVISGHTSARKVVLISGIALDDLRGRLDALLTP
jgi:uncharacterized protein